MKIETSDANDYVAAIPEGHRPHVEAVRKLVRRVVPTSAEHLESGMIRFAHGSKAFAAVESAQGSLNLHLFELSARPELMTKYEAGLAGLDMSTGCIRFQELDELPIDVIADILREAAVGGSAEKAKAAKKSAAAKPAKKASAAKKSAKTKGAKSAKPAKKGAAKRAAKKASKPASKAPAKKRPAPKAKAKKKSRR